MLEQNATSGFTHALETPPWDGATGGAVAFLAADGAAVAKPKASLPVLPAGLPILVRDGTPAGGGLDRRRVRGHRSIPRGQVLVDRIAGWRGDQGAMRVSRGGDR